MPRKQFYKTTVFAVLSCLISTTFALPAVFSKKTIEKCCFLERYPDIGQQPIQIQKSLPSVKEAPGNWFVTLEGGALFSLAGSQTSAAYVGGSTQPYEYYQSNPIQRTNLIIGAGGGYQFNFKSIKGFFPSDRVGIFYDVIEGGTVTGQMSSFAPNNPASYFYSYQIGSNTFWLDDQIDLISWQGFSPFLEAAIGLALNTAAGYQETGVASTRVSPTFGDKTVTNFAWRVGAGINYALPILKKAMKVGLSYRYSDLGPVYLQNSTTTPFPDGGATAPKIAIQNSEMLLSVSYAF